MKHLFVLILFFSAWLPHITHANLSVKNAEGVTITYLNMIQGSVAQEVLINAMSLEGIRYKYGGASPETGFDCSGFVHYVYKKVANLNLPRSASGMSRYGQTVNQHALEPGDLVFFNTLKKSFSHVGIYVGDGNFIHAPRQGSSVRVESMQTSYWKKRFDGAKRLSAHDIN